jgi:hypothetical protein
MKMTLGNTQPSMPIPDDLVLWRYLDFPKFLDLLSSKSLKMPRASKMEDGYEGMMGQAAIKETVSAGKKRGEPSYLRHASINLEQRRSFFWRDRTYISCWNAFPHENAGLWRIYGDDKGLAIRTTWKSLRTSLTGEADCVDRIYYGNVEYRNFAKNPLVAQTFTDQFFVKRNEFVHEQEFRLIAHDRTREHNYKDTSLVGIPQFATIACDLNVLIDEVLVSPRMGGWVRDAVANVSALYSGRWPVSRSNLYQPPLAEIMDF